MSSKSRSQPEPREAISISSSAWDRIVRQLDQQAQRQADTKADVEAFREKRTRYTKVITCVLRLKQGNGSAAIYRVTTRNFSGGGLGFFFKNYLHPGTTCHFALQDLHGVGQILEGEVRWCRHVSSQLHECGVQFAVPVDPADFIEADADTPHAASA